MVKFQILVTFDFRCANIQIFYSKGEKIGIPPCMHMAVFTIFTYLFVAFLIRLRQANVLWLVSALLLFYSLMAWFAW